MPSNAVFISYRREASWTLVEALYQRLVAAGIDAFYDIVDVRAGKFEEIIFNQIRARPYFVLVLTPGTLERCALPGDWVRREIEMAVASRRLIVPVYTPTFDLSTLASALPDGLGHTIAEYQAVELPHKYFRFAVQQLAEEYLVPRQIAVVATPPVDQADVERIQQAAAAGAFVTQQKLTAQELVEQAYNRREANDIEGAIADYTEAIRLNPEYSIAYNNRGEARYRAGDLDGALSDYSEALRIDPDYPEAYSNRGSVRRAKQDHQAAISDYDEAIRLDPDHAAAYNNRGFEHAGLGDVERAISDYNEAVRLDPDFAVAFVNRGNIREALGDYDGAIADFTAAIRSDNHYATAFNNRGNARQAMKDLVSAIADYTEAIRLDPAYADAFFNRALARASHGDTNGAISDIRRAQALNPDDAEFARELARLTTPRTRRYKRNLPS
jgi:tetratricopeptide (TPR) repeat protein